MIDEAIGGNKLIGIKVNKQCSFYHKPYFVNDMLLFGRSSVGEVGSFKRIL